MPCVYSYDKFIYIKTNKHAVIHEMEILLDSMPEMCEKCETIQVKDM